MAVTCQRGISVIVVFHSAIQAALIHGVGDCGKETMQVSFINMLALVVINFCQLITSPGCFYYNQCSSFFQHKTIKNLLVYPNMLQGGAGGIITNNGGRINGT
jgi:hypothetical protein